MLLNGKGNGTRTAFTEPKKAAAPAPAAVAAPAAEKTRPDYVDLAGDNVQIEVTGDQLVIKVDLRKNFGPSASGKTHTVASTRGFASIATHRGVSIALNVNRKTVN